MAAVGPVLGVDFGTSNSAAGVMRNGKPVLIELEPGETTMPTAFFFDFDTRKTLIGTAANTALINGLDGRFMRALKRVLGTSLMHEPRQIMNERVTFVDIIARFLSQVKQRAEANSGMTFERALSGRPVHFHDGDPARDAQAQEDLRACYLAAGFKDVTFLAEPEAAAIASGAAQDAAGSIGLIVDIGGGTSDFSLFETQAEGGIKILANHGIRIGGTDFDKAISVDTVMPLLGKGTLLRNEMGPGTTTTPNAIFNDLATWEKIPFLYGPSSQRLATKMHSLAQDPDKLARLAAVLEHELGHDLAFAVESGKIKANDPDRDTARIDLGVITNGLDVGLSKENVAQSLAKFASAIDAAAQETIRFADVAPEGVDRIVYVGGSSLMSFVAATMRVAFPKADHRFSDAFTAVANGLTIAAAR